MIISGIQFVLECIITNLFFVNFEKKCYIDFKIISNLASNFLNTNNLTPHENKILHFGFSHLMIHIT